MRLRHQPLSTAASYVGLRDRNRVTARAREPTIRESHLAEWRDHMATAQRYNVLDTIWPTNELTVSDVHRAFREFRAIEPMSVGVGDYA